MERYEKTTSALKEYSYKYFEKAEMTKLAWLYKSVFNAWMDAFRIKTGEDATSSEVRARIATLLKSAFMYEQEAVELMESLLKPV